jgi:diguanylate cyclase (GGDEF)-like protein/PAS domain S-box-containing protein
VASIRRLSRPLRRPVAILALVIATVPAITIGLAAEAYSIAFGAPPAQLPSLAGAMPLVALPLAALLLLMAGAGIAGRGRQVRDLKTHADQVGSRLEAVIASSDDAIILLGLDGSIGSWTPAATELYGMQADEARTKTFDSLIEPGDLVRVRQAFGRVVAGGEREVGRANHRRSGGGTFIAAASWSAVRDSRGAITGVALTVRDATAETLATARLASSERRARLLAESAIDAVITADNAGRIVEWNPAAELLFGWSVAEARALTLDDLVPPTDANAPESWHAIAGRVVRVVARRRDGSGFEAEAGVAVYEDDGHRFTTAFVRDVTERAVAERRARASEGRYRSLVEHLPGVVYAAGIGRWTPVEYASPQIAELLGYQPHEWVGIAGMWEEHVHPDDLQRVLGDDEWDASGSCPTKPDREYRMRRRDGREIWVRDHSVLETDDEGKPVRWQGYLTDITERKRLEADLLRLAFHDPLTGLANRALLNDRVAKAVASSERGPGLVAMLLADVDDFKRINDAHGHDVGDRLLVAVARRLREHVRPGVTVARLGGDEFAILVEGLNEEAGALAIAQRIVTAFDEPFRIEGLQLGARLSVGVAVDINRKGSPAWLLRAADLAMYEAKGLGKGRWRVYDPQAHLASARRLVLESELRRAVERKQFLLYYQPVRDFQTGEIVGSEALLRWNHPKRGIVAPGEFIPTLESSGLIAEVGRWVVDEASRQAAEWAATLPSMRWTAVNVSAAQLRGDSFVGFVRDTIARHGLAPGRLSLEITESLALDDSPETADLLRRLRDLGTRIAVDDFGTGYSSLAYLRRLPIDRIKIDRSFVEGVGTDPEATALVRVIVELARSLHLSTVAEGIEQETQARTLAELGCDMGQGFLLGRPLEPAALASLVRAQLARRELAAAG